MPLKCQICSLADCLIHADTALIHPSSSEPFYARMIHRTVLSGFKPVGWPSYWLHPVCAFTAERLRPAFAVMQHYAPAVLMPQCKSQKCSRPLKCCKTTHMDVQTHSVEPVYYFYYCVIGCEFALVYIRKGWGRVSIQMYDFSYLQTVTVAGTHIILGSPCQCYP